VSGVDSVTVLTTKGPLATKRVTLPPGATRPVIEQYGNAAFFSIREAPVSGIDDLAALLSMIELRPTSFLVRGKPAAGVDPRNARRRLHARKAKDGTVEQATIQGAARHWIPLDLDSIACPVWLDPVHEADRTVEHVVALLPDEFNSATCWWSFTSSQEFKPGLRMRLFFWSDRQLTDADLKLWLGERMPQADLPHAKWPQRYPVDLTIFAPAQPIYVARPIFVGMPDPVPFRSGVWRGDRDAITPPAIEKPRVRATGVTKEVAGEPGSGYESFRSRIGDHEGGDGFFAPIKSAVASWIALQGASTDTGWLRADLERAIRDAPRDPVKHPDDYLEIRVRDLDPLIASILALEAASEAARRQADECEPTYPAPLATVEEARERLAQALDEHVASIAPYAAARAAYRADLKRWHEQTSMAA
jgi:hypothetical protein